MIQCYERLVNDREHPVFALWIDIDSERIDVNIHPQKHEVKFDDERSVFLVIQQAVVQALSKANLIPNTASFVPLAQAPLQSLRGAGPGQIAVNRFTGEILDAPAQRMQQTVATQYAGQQFEQTRITAGHHRGYEQLMAEVPAEHPARILFVERGLAFCRHEEGLMVVRLFPAMERVFFEQIRSKRSEGAVSAEQLLFPVHVSLEAADIALFQEHSDLISAMGYDVTIQDSTVTILGLPWYVAPAQEESALHDVLEGLRDLTAQARVDGEERLLIRLARRRAMLASADVKAEHVQEIVTELRTCTMSHISPSGMATFVIIPFDEIQSRLL